MISCALRKPKLLIFLFFEMLSSSSHAYSYTYDEESRLSQVQVPATTSYAYDAFNRRVSKITGTDAIYYVHDGDHVIEERNNAGALIADYTYGPMIDEALTMSRGGQTYYYFTDALGSVRNVTDSAGTLIESYDYDAYGKPKTLSTINNPIMFTGRWYDVESGNYYYRARYYSPTLGRFLHRDPIGYWDSMNLYQYVFNSPTNYTDPTGELVLIAPIIWEATQWAIIGWGAYQLWKNMPKQFPAISNPFSNPASNPSACPILSKYGSDDDVSAKNPNVKPHNNQGKGKLKGSKKETHQRNRPGFKEKKKEKDGWVSNPNKRRR